MNRSITYLEQLIHIKLIQTLHKDHIDFFPKSIFICFQHLDDYSMHYRYSTYVYCQLSYKNKSLGLVGVVENHSPVHVLPFRSLPPDRIYVSGSVVYFPSGGKTGRPLGT